MKKKAQAQAIATAILQEAARANGGKVEITRELEDRISKEIRANVKFKRDLVVELNEHRNLMLMAF